MQRARSPSSSGSRTPESPGMQRENTAVAQSSELRTPASPRLVHGSTLEFEESSDGVPHEPVFENIVPQLPPLDDVQRSNNSSATADLSIECKDGCKIARLQKFLFIMLFFTISAIAVFSFMRNST